ncbi:hypothetical protein [Bradyrhizobium aeschynomenes]|uniref:hypothetical protein n=1 Tax=Bradyrhizobium aeschynomenes TaxID=2734909 RepID=UPI0015528703|nr:hypothetical protein [Bradyrhizobium aeschynomenes]NPV24301.1 hypothetical protein [Bradyrhizobium aeschynomenes]
MAIARFADRHVEPSGDIMRFCILLNGQDFVTIIAGEPTSCGFFTTCILDAPTADVAVDRAVSRVLADDRWRKPGRAGTVTVAKLEQVGWFYRRFNPPRGYTFYLDQGPDD